MSSRSKSVAFPDSANRTQWSAHLESPSSPRRVGSDPLSSEDIDAQIRWYFENVLEGETLRPR
jgi:hypothetical protein